MGGDGSIYLALKYPDVFSVAAPVSGTYYWERDPIWQRAIGNFDKLPEDFCDIHTLGWEVRALYASAAATASNPDKPPFYLDTPLAIVDGKTQIVPEVFDKIAASDPAHEVDRFLAQPERLNAILILHGEGDNFGPVELARDFDQLLSDRGVEHEYLEVNGGHCDFLFTPVVTFMSAHLVGEK